MDYKDCANDIVVTEDILTDTTDNIVSNFFNLFTNKTLHVPSYFVKDNVVTLNEINPGSNFEDSLEINVVPKLIRYYRARDEFHIANVEYILNEVLTLEV